MTHALARYLNKILITLKDLLEKEVKGSWGEGCADHLAGCGRCATGDDGPSLRKQNPLLTNCRASREFSLIDITQVKADGAG
jgi:hypothetical protein